MPFNRETKLKLENEKIVIYCCFFFFFSYLDLEAERFNKKGNNFLIERFTNAASFVEFVCLGFVK